MKKFILLIIASVSISLGFSQTSSNADLSAMTISSGTLTPAFNSATIAYTATVPNAVTSITVTPTRADANATIEVQVNGDGYTTVTSGSASDALALNVGSNTINVKVTAEDGTTIKTYTATLTRLPLPVITSFTPSSGSIGTLVTITGTDLSAPTALTIGGVDAIIISNTGSSLVAMVMTGATTGTINITTAAGNTTSTTNYTVVASIAPTVQQAEKLVGSGAVGDAKQGRSVSVSADGNTAIVGGYSDNDFLGAAWVYTRSDGVWSQQGEKLVGTGSSTQAFQGTSVSLSADGNTAIVGGSRDNDFLGAIWIYTRSGGVWSQQGDKLVGTGAVGNARQGTSVSLSADGNTAIVSGNTDNYNTGALWVYTRSDGVWSQQGDKLVGLSSLSVSLSADGNTVLVGDHGDNNSQGAAWVYTRSDGVWSQQGEKLVGTGAVGSANQGTSVSLSADGNTAIVGGPLDNSQAGAVWVYTRSNGVWSQQGDKLAGTGATSNAQQGYSVSLSADGNTAIVSGNADNFLHGALWVYTRSDGVWSQVGNKLVGTGATGAAAQGASVSLSADGNTGIVGGYLDNYGTGAIWVYYSDGATALDAGFSADVTSGDAPLTVNFTDASTGSPTSWAWTFEGGTPSSSTDQNPTSIAFSTAGTFDVTLVATNADGSDTETKTDYITVSEGSTGGAIVSTTAGGLWTETTTWIGGVVPTASDDVIIDGTVEVNGGWECKNITVNSGKILTTSINVSTIKVNGNVINNGTIQNNDWMAFYVEVLGDITNNGLWSTEKIRMVGTTDQTISGSQPYSSAGFTMGIGYEGTGQTLIAGSDLSFINTLFYFNNSEFMIEEGKTVSFSNVLETDNGRIGKCHFIGGGTIHSDSLFYFTDSTSFKNVTLTGIIQTGGLIIIKENVKLLGVIQSYGNTDRVEFAEDFVNDGTIRDNDWRSLDVTVLKNITNDSSWENYQIEMNGTSDQTFTNNGHLYSQFNINANVSSATTFQWYKDGVAIDDVYATGEVYYYTKQASYEDYNPYGVYYCQTDAGNSRTITISGSGSGGGEVILAENFDGTVFPPNGWTQAISNGAKTWMKGNPEDNPFTNIDTSNVYSAICPWVAENQDEWLKTPVVALPDEAILLEFYAGFSTAFLSNSTLKLNVSTDGGTNWNKIWEANDDGEAWKWRKVSVDISGYANNSNVMLAWQYVGADGDLIGIDNVKITQGTTGIGDQPSEAGYSLSQNYPNPFTSQTRIAFNLAKKANVSLIIYNSLGQKIAEPFAGPINAGDHQFTFDATGLKAGIYFYRFVLNGFSTTKRMVLVK